MENQSNMYNDQSNLSVLKGDEQKKAEGSFVYTSQGVATEHGFNHVSKFWYPKTLSYDDFCQKMEEQKKFCEDIYAPLSEFQPTVNDNGKFVLRYKDGRDFNLDEVSCAHLAKWVGVGSYAIECLYFGKTDLGDSETLVKVVNNGFRKVAEDKPFLWRVHNGENRLRALLTDSYGIVNNGWFMDSIRKLIPGGRVSHHDKSDVDTIYANILIPDTIREENDSDYGGMLSISNSEIGVRRLGTLPSIFRAICMNGCIWGQTKGEKLQKRHRKGKNTTLDLDFLFHFMQENLEKQIPLLPMGIRNLIETQGFKFDGSPEPYLATLANNYKLAKNIASELIPSFNVEPSNNLFGLINAVTRTAQKFDGKVWVDMDTLAGEMLGLTTRWDTFKTQAKILTVDEVNALLAVSA